jgi:hypothetical protein
MVYISATMAYTTMHLDCEIGKKRVNKTKKKTSAIAYHISSTHLRKYVEAGKEGDCFDNKMCIPMACNTKLIGNQLP